MKRVIEHPRYHEYFFEQMTDEKYIDATKDTRYKCCNVEYRDCGRIKYKVTDLDHFEKIGFTPTKHKILHRIRDIVKKVELWFKFHISEVEPTREQNVIREYIGNEADKYVREAEDECYRVCERCGTQIGTTYSPRCITSGWVSYICEKCAKEKNAVYTKTKPDKDDECENT